MYQLERFVSEVFNLADGQLIAVSIFGSGPFIPQHVIFTTENNSNLVLESLAWFHWFNTTY
jgi:hypothetical protein